MKRSRGQPRPVRRGLAAVWVLAAGAAVTAPLVVLDRDRAPLLAGAPTMSAIGAAPRPVPRVVVDPACSAAVAYESEGPSRADGQAGEVWFVVPSDGGLDGLLGALTLGPGVTLADLGDPSLRSKVSSRPDGAGVVQWHRGEEAVALLSAKRADTAGLRALSAAIGAGDAGRAGHSLVVPPDSAVAVAGHSCSLSGAFVGVETVSGSPEALVGYLLTVDPTRIDLVDGGLVAQFNRLDGAPLPLEVIGPTEWSSLLAASPKEGP